ncbi:atp-dependent dna helicase srs2 [Ophiostoma piceae UAMH 11346]|uniref:DNA 3'-5' helicase n=1 Tax=Ophiostoma piceae (strain UAMH 11346) TaxID=1262450 RepID=S3CA08_OPHP1|nr:atp-dependent dna helicase srs2 [Ophiostoma piceae UAMH 11346]
MTDIIDLCSESESDGESIIAAPKATKSGPATSLTSSSTSAQPSKPKQTVAATTKPLASIFTRKAPPIKKPAEAVPEKSTSKPQPKSRLKANPKTKLKETTRPPPPAPVVKSEYAPVHMPACGPEAILASLNNAQRRAVTSGCNTVAILAGPGSGKTHTLTSRVAWLIDMMGYAPANVIVATFTVKASREMKERIGKVLGNGREKKIILGTFHSVALRYLSTYGPRIGLKKGFSIADDGDSKSIIKRIIKRLNFDTDHGVARAWISKKKAKGCLGLSEKEQEEEMRRSNRPRPMQSVQKAEKSAESNEITAKFEAIHSEYQQHMASLNLLDYDDLLVKCTELLRAHPVCVSNVQAVLIDEYQDTNGIQFELMKLFAQARNRITVVGDPDQSIYGWRSAEITNLSRFLCDFPDTAEVSLEENYRSSRSILETSLQVIKQDSERYDKSLLSLHKKGSMPVMRRLLDSAHEARWIVHEIKRATQLTGNMVNHGDIAILVRSATLSRPIEQALARAAIPYRMIGGRKFFERAEIKLLVDYLRIISQPSQNEVLTRIINNPKRGVGAATIAGLQEEAETGNMCLWDLVTKHCRGDIKAKTSINGPTEKRISSFVGFMKTLRRRLDGNDEDRDDIVEDFGINEDDTKGAGDDDDGEEGGADVGDNDKESTQTSQQKDEQKTVFSSSNPFHIEPAKPYDLVELLVALIERLNYRAYIGATFGGDDETRWANVEEFINMAREFMSNSKQLFLEDQLPEIEGVAQNNQTNVLSTFIANITLSADADKKNGEETTPMVTISTIHAAKGLEWPVVFIPAAYDGSLPHKRSDDFNEERRLLYVAMTRAKCLLNVSYGLFYTYTPTEDKNPTERTLSPFLEPVWNVWFSETGPSFNRDLLEEMGDILRRPVPSDHEIYKSLPTDAALEDSAFPIDPNDAKRRVNDNARDIDFSNGRARGERHSAQQSNQRRQLSSAPNYNLQGGEGREGPWQRGYSTTMEGASSGFTMGAGAGQYSGFVSAAKHRDIVVETKEEPTYNLTALAADKKRQRISGKAAGNSKALLAGQQTMMQTFFRSNSTSTTAVTVDDDEPPKVSLPPRSRLQMGSTPARTHQGGYQKAAGMFSRRQEVSPAAVLPGIPAELKSRSLGGVRRNMMSIAGRHPGAASSRMDKMDRANRTEGMETKVYSHFSSSPTRPEPAQPAEVPSNAVPVPPMNGRQLPLQAQPQPPTAQPAPSAQPYAYNRPRPYNNVVQPSRTIGGKENLHTTRTAGTGSAKPLSRPAASFHTTTCTLVTSGHGSLKRQAERISGDIAPIERLRQPFRPPTMRRP